MDGLLSVTSTVGCMGSPPRPLGTRQPPRSRNLSILRLAGRTGYSGIAGPFTWRSTSVHLEENPTGSTRSPIRTGTRSWTRSICSSGLEEAVSTGSILWCHPRTGNGSTSSTGTMRTHRKWITTGCRVDGEKTTCSHGILMGMATPPERWLRGGGPALQAGRNAVGDGGERFPQSLRPGLQRAW